MPSSRLTRLAPPDLKDPLGPSPRSPLALLTDSCVCTAHAALRVSGSYSGWVRLAKLATHAMETVDTSCGGAGIACQQLGAD